MKRYFKSQILRSAKWGVQKGGKMNINVNMLLGNQLLVETVVIGACMLVFTCVVLNAIRKGHGFRNFLNSLIVAIAVSAVRYCVSTVSPVAGAVIYAAMILLYLYLAGNLAYGRVVAAGTTDDSCGVENVTSVGE